MADDGTLQIQGSPRLALRLLGASLLPVAFLVVARPDLLHAGAYRSLRDILVAGVLVAGFAALLVTLARRAATARRPALRISPAGVEDLRRGVPLVPWAEVRDITATERRRGISAITLQLDDTGIARLRGASALARWTRGSTLSFAPAALDIDAKALLAAFNGARADARRAVPADAQAAADAAAFDPTLDLVAAVDARRPTFTYLLLALLVAIFALQMAEATPDGRSALGLTPTALLREGGLTQETIAAGAYWRLLASIFLHINVVHLFLNGIALLYAGRVLETLVGWRPYAAVFAVSGIAGAVASAALVAPQTVAVGAAGGIVGLFAATCVLALHYPKGALRTHMLKGAGRVLFPTLLTALPAYGLHADLAGLAGGALGGAIVGAVLLARWPTGQPRPRAGFLVTAVPAAFGACSALALAFAVHDNALWSAFATDLPASYVTMVQHSAILYAQHPLDPRVRYARAVALYAADDKDAARAILQGTLDDHGRAGKIPEAEHLTRTLLAVIADERGEHEAARALARPLCGTGESNIKPIVDRFCGAAEQER